jgi:hypothetical protein
VRLGLKHIATLFGVAAVAAAVGTAPVAVAAQQEDSQQSEQPEQSCDQRGASQYVCEGPGNAQLNDPPSATNYYSIIG